MDENWEKGVCVPFLSLTSQVNAPSPISNLSISFQIPSVVSLCLSSCLVVVGVVGMQKGGSGGDGGGGGVGFGVSTVGVLVKQGEEGEEKGQAMGT